MKVKMGQIIKINFTLPNNEKQSLYEKKLIKIRDDIEDYLDKIDLVLISLNYYN